MAKYNERLVEKIVRLIEEDTYTVGEICDALKISRNTFYEWKNSKSEFYQALEEAENRRDASLAILARRSLREQLDSYIVTTEKIVYTDNGYGEETIKSKTVTKRKVAAKASIIKLALVRSDRKQEKKEATALPQRQDNPIILRFPKEVSQTEAVKMMTDFRNVISRNDFTQNSDNYETANINDYISIKV
ncbi:TetR/AcrR family transcriptional regulator [Dysgonomonas sp. BGC7]|uniref:TetR/AcrR family transcriptional regulator n=1 Tax=Dysgonomonas sp. BGC7 TaxID=1658008 RepID=UPI000681D3ED|nr:transposase [Dysgonomonas sp. BGC7]MBD8388542.1 hypothetical protein [Dysgonomonas sp. BGC7]